MFQKKKQYYSLVIRLGCNAFILAKRSEKTVNCTFQNHRPFECEIPRDLTLKVKGRAVTSETGQQPNMEVVPLQCLVSLHWI